MIYEDGQIMRVREPVLLNVLEGISHSVAHLPKVDPKECWINGSGIVGRLYLTYLAKSLFSIHRLPFCEEKFRMSIDYDPAKKFFTGLSELTIIKSMEELNRLYQHTQKILNSDFFDNYFGEKKSGGMIKLKRGVGLNYAHAMIAHAMYAKRNGYDTIPIPTWILSGYAFSEAYTSDVEFSVAVPIEDILICSRTVSFSGNPDMLVTLDEEFIVVNREPSGIINININDIKFDYTYQKRKLEDLIDKIGLYSNNYFNSMYPKPNILHEFYPMNIREPKVVRFVKWLYDIVEKYKIS